MAAGMEAHAEELNTLDGMLGDGDLGVTVVRGLRGVQAAVPNLPGDVGMALLACAQAFTRTSGSTFGTLLAIGLMSAARATRGREDVPWQEMPSLLATAVAAISHRGDSRLGEKTMLDSLDAIRVACEGAKEPSDLLPCAMAAGKAALDEFRGKPAQQGRARIFGEKSVGRDDPGMVAVLRMVESLEHPPPNGGCTCRGDRPHPKGETPLPQPRGSPAGDR